jgi:hypothetical protein
VRLDEQERARELFGVIALASADAGRYGIDGYPTPETFVDHLRALTPALKLTVVALASPSDTPAAGSIGFYSDGAQHVATVVLSATGRRLFLEYDVDDVLRTNVVGYIYGDD